MTKRRGGRIGRCAERLRRAWARLRRIEWWLWSGIAAEESCCSDYLGLALGQTTTLPTSSNPWQRYCSPFNSPPGSFRPDLSSTAHTAPATSNYSQPPSPQCSLLAVESSLFEAAGSQWSFLTASNCVARVLRGFRTPRRPHRKGEQGTQTQTNTSCAPANTSTPSTRASPKEHLIPRRPPTPMVAPPQTDQL